MSTRRGSSTQVAESVPFDNEGTDFEATDVQGAIEEIGASASPGFSFGRAGNISSGTWLLNEGVSSNRAGRYVFITSPEISEIFSASEDLDTYTISIYEHEGDEVNLTLLDTLSVTAARGGQKVSNVAMTSGRQLAIRVTAGSAKNIVVGLILKGTRN